MGIKQLLIIIGLLLSLLQGWAQGLPIIRQFSAEDYHAHNRNFDIVTQDDGTVYIANFEGLLYYDQAEWRVLHTPGYTNLVSLYIDHEGTVWTGGYNFFGRLQTSDNGELHLQPVATQGLFNGEIEEIWEDDGVLTFMVDSSTVFQLQQDKIVPVTHRVQIPNRQTVTLEGGIVAQTVKDQGIKILNTATSQYYIIGEHDGLCSNNVECLAYDGHGLLWGSTDNGLFCLAVPSPYSTLFDADEQIGDVMSITPFGSHMYFGTSKGLYRQEGRSLVKVHDISFAAWVLLDCGNRLLIGTANGVYALSSENQITQMTTESCTALFCDGEDIYYAQTDGLWLSSGHAPARQLCSLPYVVKIIKDHAGTLWLQSVYGQVWKGNPQDGFTAYAQADSLKSSAATIVDLGDRVEVIGAQSRQPMPYPAFSLTDREKTVWLTDHNAQGLYSWKDGTRQHSWDRFLFPLQKETIRSVYHHQHELWVGQKNGVMVIDTCMTDPTSHALPHLRFCSVTLNADSILWGGFTPMPFLRLASDERQLSFTYAIDHPSLAGPTLYRYRLNAEPWSSWSVDKSLRLNGLSHGSFTLTVQALLPTGLTTNDASINFVIETPFYLRWYMQLLYVLLLGLLVYAFIRWRTHRLKKEKIKLEGMVEERTAQLNAAHEELVRSEKMATIGKLTHGLVDRILNPLNYINNFATLSKGLADDIKANIEESKERMDEDCYEDTKDVIDMLQTDLKEIEHHGQNTTRVVKAMGEILKERSTNFEPLDLCQLLSQLKDSVQTTFANDIKALGIQFQFDIPDGQVNILGNAHQLTTVFFNILTNSVYAITKKTEKGEQFQPLISLKAITSGPQVTLTFCDNGIGVEEKNVEKVFDPFFTTKPTSEATGIGLYICREIIQNHHGEITVSSQKDVITEFTIALPIQTEER